MDSSAARNGQGVEALAAAVGPTAPPVSEPDRARGQASAKRALEDVYRQHQRFVWRSLARLGVADPTLSDATHDVFMVVARRLPEFEARASIKTWLFAICLRIARSKRRDYAREQKRREQYGLTRAGTHADPHGQADAARTLRDLLQQLGEDKRAVFIMAELEEMTAPEIASVLGIKPATVYSRLRLARAELERSVQRQHARERREKGDAR